MVETSQVCVRRNPGLLWPVTGGYCYLGYREVMNVGHWLQILLQVNCIFWIPGRIRYCIRWVVTSQQFVLTLPPTCSVPGKVICNFLIWRGEICYIHSFNLLPVMNIKNLCPAALVSTAFESIVSWQGIEPRTPILEAKFLTTVQPRKSYRWFKAIQRHYTKLP